MPTHRVEQVLVVRGVHRLAAVAVDYAHLVSSDRVGWVYSLVLPDCEQLARALRQLGHARAPDPPRGLLQRVGGVGEVAFAQQAAAEHAATRRVERPADLE